MIKKNTSANKALAKGVIQNKTKIKLDQTVEARVSERGAVEPAAGIPSPESDGQAS